MCKGTQYHHHHPRSQSLESLLHWWGNPIGSLPGTLMLLAYGPLLRQLRPARRPIDEPWYQLLVLAIGLAAPLSYVFHQNAHTPPSERGTLAALLQSLGLALSPHFHKVHHREPNHTWSVMAGLMDWLPNRFMAARMSDARAALLAILTMTLLPWYLLLGGTRGAARRGGEPENIRRRCK